MGSAYPPQYAQVECGVVLGFQGRRALPLLGYCLKVWIGIMLSHSMLLADCAIYGDYQALRYQGP